MFFKQSPERFPEISDRSRRIECRTLMKKLLTVSVFLLLWSMQAFGSQSKLSQFSALTPKRRAALQARLAARAQAGYAATPGRPALTPGSFAAPNAAPNAVGKTRSTAVFLLLWSMQAFGSQSKLSQFSALTPKRRAAVQARLAARAQAGYAATPGRPALTPGSFAAPNAAPNAVGKTRSTGSHPYNNPPSNPPVNPV